MVAYTSTIFYVIAIFFNASGKIGDQSFDADIEELSRQHLLPLHNLVSHFLVD